MANASASSNGGRRPGGQRPRLSDRGSQLRRAGGGGRRLRPARRGRLQRGRAQDRLHHQGVPDPLPHGGGAGRHLGLARQYGRGRLALAHVRHRQGLGLARRPGHHRIHVPQRPGRGLRARALGRAVLAHRGRQDLSAPVRRHDHPLRQGHRATHLRGRRPHRPRHAAHHVRPGAAPFGRVLHRIFRHRPDHGRGRPLPRRRRDLPRRRLDPPLPRPHDHPGHRRLRAQPISPAPRRIPAPATATPWCCAPACRSRTWSSSSSIRPASTEPAA